MTRPAGGRGPVRPVGVATRGTTAPNRLRRVDRWISGTSGRLLCAAADPLVVDLGYGASPVTTMELADRLRVIRPDVRVVGLEIDPERVAAAARLARPGVEFRRGGFELAGLRPVLVRALNVLRQYAEHDVAPAWHRMTAALAPGGLLVEGTCDELGRLAAWVAVTADGPQSLTLAASLRHLEQPSDLAERLPKALIHRNVPGEPISALLCDLDRAWAAAAPVGVFGPRQRWIAAAEDLRSRWPVTSNRSRHRLGELTVAWSAVAPTR